MSLKLIRPSINWTSKLILSAGCLGCIGLSHPLTVDSAVDGENPNSGIIKLTSAGTSPANRGDRVPLQSFLPQETVNEKILVAVIDTGVNLSHPALAGRIWQNPGETGRDAKGRDKASNGIDDDGNGFIDDVHGWNFVKHNSDVRDLHGHGTHIAGIIGGQGVGISNHVQLMILKYYDPELYGTGTLEKTVSAIDYAIQNGARIINYSGGGLEPFEIEKKAVARAAKRGVLVVAAAGNENQDADEIPFYPANYGLPNILSVAAHDLRAQLLTGSNYGLRSVDLAAPGSQIVSLGHRGGTAVLSGTSQATAFATGAAAEIMARNPDLEDAITVKARLLAASHFEDSLRAKTRRQSRLELSNWKGLADPSWDVTGAPTLNGAGIPRLTGF